MAQGRRVRRVIRRIDSWSVMKVASLFFSSLVIILLLAGSLLWLAGSSVGAIGGVEKFVRGIGFEGFKFAAGQLLRGFIAAGILLIVIGTGCAVLMAVIYNLISDVVGGIQLTVLEEEPARSPVVSWPREALPVEDNGVRSREAARLS